MKQQGEDKAKTEYNKLMFTQQVDVYFNFIGNIQLNENEKS